MTRKAAQLVEALAKCLEWVEDNGGELVFSSHGNVELADEEGEIVAGFDGFTVESGAEQLAALLEQAHAPAPAPAAPPIVAVAKTWFGLGESRFAWDERRTLIFTPGRDFLPEVLRIPSACAGYLIFQARMGGAALLTANDGVPIELFSEVSTAPQILFPRLGPDSPLELDVRAPSCPKAPSPFSGAFFGVQAEKK